MAFIGFGFNSACLIHSSTKNDSQRALYLPSIRRMLRGLCHVAGILPMPCKTLYYNTQLNKLNQVLSTYLLRREAILCKEMIIDHIQHRYFISLSFAVIVAVGATVLLVTACAEPENIETTIRSGTVDEVEDLSTGETMVLSEIDTMIADMTLEEKVGQMMMFGFEGLETNTYVNEFLEEMHVGSLIMFGRNIDTSEQVQELNTSLKDIARNSGQEVGLMITVDQEGEPVKRFASVAPTYSQPEIGSMGEAGTAEAKLQAQLTAEGLSDLGLDANLAPVVDVSAGPGTIMESRSFSTDPAIVESMTAAAITGYNQAGFISCAKHFPGHGFASGDSEIELPIVSGTYAEIEQRDLKPFTSAINNGVPMVMVGHLSVPSLDPSATPASLSQPIISGILRNQLGFQGVIISDDLEMGAITNNWGIGEAAVKAINAGSDMLIVAHTYDLQLEVYQAVLDAAQTGAISEAHINESVSRILSMKQAYGLS